MTTQKDTLAANRDREEMAALVGICAIAAGMWFVLFSPWTQGMVNFWWGMVAAAGLLAALGTWQSRSELRRLWAFRWLWVAVGATSAAVLYGVFWLGHVVSTALLAGAGEQVARVYEMRSQGQEFAIAAALLLWIGPAEEIFWRGYVQRRLGQRLGKVGALLVATALYTVVHVWAGNPMLLVAAAVCGLFWGVMFLRLNDLWPVVISHALWDVAVFVIWPVGR